MLTVFICLIVACAAIFGGYYFGSHYKISINRKVEYTPDEDTENKSEEE